MKTKVGMWLFAIMCIFIGLSLSASPLQAVSGVNKKNCEEWCKAHSDSCHKCSDNAGCGVGYQPIATFKWIYDNDHWHACNGGSSELNKKACEDWCNQHKNDNVFNCVKCSPETGCGTGYKVLYSFTGSGKNFHACGKSEYGRHSDENKAACEKWCQDNKGKGCVKCDTKRYCGSGYEAMKHFEGKGENWHACKKK